MVPDDTPRIVRNLLSEPHIEGRRISVRQIHKLVEEREQNPEAVADRFDLDVADVYHALAYYHDHPRKMRDVVEERENAMAVFRESIARPESVQPDVV